MQVINVVLKSAQCYYYTRADLKSKISKLYHWVHYTEYHVKHLSHRERWLGNHNSRIIYASCMCVCVCERVYKVHTISFQTFFVWALLLTVHTWNSSPLQSNLLQLQYTCCTVPTTSGRPHGSPLVCVCQWPSSQPLLSP